MRRFGPITSNNTGETPELIAGPGQEQHKESKLKPCRSETQALTAGAVRDPECVTGSDAQDTMQRVYCVAPLFIHSDYTHQHFIHIYAFFYVLAISL